MIKKRTLPLFLSFVLLGMEAQAQEKKAWKWTAQAVVDAVTVGTAALSPDGKTIVFGRTRWRGEGAKPGPGYYNLWRIPFDGGEPERLTYADAEDGQVRFAPDGKSIAFLSARDGGKARVWSLPLQGGEARALTSEKVSVARFEFSPDGKLLAYLAVEPLSEQEEKDRREGKDAIVAGKSSRQRRLWILDLSTGKAEALASLGTLSAWDFDWSPDGTALVATVTDKNNTDESYMKKRIAILPRNGALRELVPVVGKVGEVYWSLDGKQIAWLAGVDASDPSTGSLFVIPASGGSPKNLTEKREELASSLSWRKDGTIALVTVVGTKTVLESVDPKTGNRTKLLEKSGVAFMRCAFSQDGKRYAFVGSSASHNNEVFSATTDAKAPKRLTRSNPSIEGYPLGAQETIRYKAKDGLEIEGVLIRPVGFSEKTKYPLIVVAHGGPESQFLDAWMNVYAMPGQALAERGYMVFFPNYRGSTGRGVAFSKADHKDLGGKEFTDVLDGVDYLIGKGWVDAKRVGITGGSYGGYFTALGVTKYSDRFAAGVDLFGITNWASFLGQSDIPEENSLVHWDLWCYENAELCRDRSPVDNIQKAKTPTLILQGEQDLRVPKAQSDELYAALVWKKVPVEYVVYPREGHGFQEREHRIDTFTRLMDWMDVYVKNAK